ncbi:MAG TPA: TonB-dependent receptor, partial [Polyangiaceae bacterium]
SWVDAWLKPVLEEAGSNVTSAPVYYDYQVIVDHEPSRDAKLSMRFYGSSDRLELILNDPAAQDPAFGGNLDFSTQFYRGQVLYQDQLSRDVKLQTMLSVGRDAFEFSLGTFLFDIAAYPISFRSEFGVRLARGATLNAGTDLVVAPFDLVARLPPPPRPGEPDPGPFAAQPPLESRQSSTVFRPGWYADVELEPARRLRVIPGFRFDYARDSGHGDFSPRVTARYDVIANERPDRFERTTLKGGVGFFHQPPQFQETDEVFGTPGLLSNRSIHYSLGVERELSRQVELGVEGFYKDFTRLVSRDESAAGGFEYNNDGTGKALGLETLLKYKPDERFFGWLAYTLSRSVRKDGAEEEERSFDFDQTHNLIVLGSYRIGRGWEVGSRFRIVSGPLTTPVVAPPALPGLYAADGATYVGLRGEPFSRRLPLFHQLDIRIDKRWQFRSWRLSAFLDVQNVYNNQAVEALVYNYNFSQERFLTGLPIIPSLGVRGEF